MRDNEKAILTNITQDFLRDPWYISNVMPALFFSFSLAFFDVLS